MKKLRTVLAAVMAIAMLFALCACGETTTETASSSTSDEAVVIKMGGIGPLTGGAAIYGQAVKNAMEIAVDEVNALGGVQFELNFQDDAHDAEQSVNAYGNLMDWGMQLLVGPVTTTPSAAVAAEAEADGVFMLTPSASGTSVIENTTNVFQMCFTDPNQGIASADYMADNGIGNAIAVIYNNGDAYSTGIYNKFAEEAETKGLNIVYVGTFTDDSASDFSTQLTGAQQAGADVIFLPIYYTPISLIMAQAQGIGYEGGYFGVDGMDGLLDLEGFDTSLAEGAYLLTPFSADKDDDLTKNFVAEYQSRYGETPNQFAADAYDCVYAVYELCNEAGITSDMSAEEISEILVPLFTGDFSFSGLTGSDMTWAATGEVSKSPMAVIIQDATYVSAN